MNKMLVAHSDHSFTIDFNLSFFNGRWVAQSERVAQIIRTPVSERSRGDAYIMPRGKMRESALPPVTRAATV